MSDASTKPLYEYLPASGGYRTTVSFLPTTDRKGVPHHSDSVKAIQSFYKDNVNELETLVDSLSKEEFQTLVDDELSRFLINSYYAAKQFQAISKGEKERVSDYLKQSLDIQRKILEHEKSIKSSIGIGFRGSLKFSNTQQKAIKELCTLLEGSDKWRSVVYQRVFFTLIEQCAIAIKNKSDEFWKSLNQFPPYEYTKLKKLKDLFQLSENLPEDVIRYIGISRDNLESELRKLRSAVDQSIVDYKDGLHQDNIGFVYQSFKDLMDIQDKLDLMKDSIDGIKDEALKNFRTIRDDKI